MKINGFRDWARFARLYMAGAAIAGAIRNGVDWGRAVSNVLPGNGNNRSRWGNYQTDWTGRRTQTREAARRLRQHKKAGHSYLEPVAGNSGWVQRWWVRSGVFVARCAVTYPPHPHAAKPAPGTAQPLARDAFDRIMGMTRFSDGTLVTDRDIRAWGHVTRAPRHEGWPYGSANPVADMAV